MKKTEYVIFFPTAQLPFANPKQLMLHNEDNLTMKISSQNQMKRIVCTHLLHFQKSKEIYRKLLNYAKVIKTFSKTTLN